MGNSNPKYYRRSDVHIYTADGRLKPEVWAKVLQVINPKTVGLRSSNNPTLEPLPYPYPRTLQIPNTPLFRDIEDYLNSTGYQRETIKMPAMAFIQENQKIFDHNPFVGYFGVTDRYCKIKWTNIIPWTATEVATTYIKLCEEAAGTRLKVKYNKIHDICRSYPTIYFSGQYKGDLAYIDLKHAYWQILAPTCPDMEYDTDTQEIASTGQIPYIATDEFSVWKDVRLVLGSLFNYRWSKIWDLEEKTIIRRAIPSPLYRPYNLAYVFDFINALVLDAKQNFPIRQWLTDAAIIDGKYADTFQDWLANCWYLESRIEAHGEGDSKATNYYKIEPDNGLPGKKSRHFHTTDKGTKKPHNRLQKEANTDGLRYERWKLLKEITDIEPIRKSNKMYRAFFGGKFAVENAIPFTTSKLEKKDRQVQNSNRIPLDSLDNAIPMKEV